MSIDDRLMEVQGAILTRLGTRAHLKPTGLLEKLAVDTGLHPQDVRRALSRLHDRGWLSGVARNGEPLGEIKVLAPRDPAPEAETLVAWRHALDCSGLKGHDRDCLSSAHSLLAGLEENTLRRIAAGMAKLREAHGKERDEPRFIVSARYLIGSSKLLSMFPTSVLRKFFGVGPTWTDQIPYVVTAGPAEPVGVILIENPWAFERAVNLGMAEQHALIVTFGYGLSRQGSAFGRQLASQIEEQRDQLIQLRRHGAPPELQQLFKHQNLTFWGDLDPEGLRIYMRLKQRLPQLQLSPLYEAMGAHLAGDGGHPYHAVTGKEGQVALTEAETRDFPELAALAAACAHCGLDQEALSEEALKDCARQVLA
jgi:hypothetical protein